MPDDSDITREDVIENVERIKTEMLERTPHVGLLTTDEHVYVLHQMLESTIEQLNNITYKVTQLEQLVGGAVMLSKPVAPK